MIESMSIFLLILPSIYILVFSESKVEFIMVFFIITYVAMYLVAHFMGLRVDVSFENDTSTTNETFVTLFYLFFLGYITQKLFFRARRLKKYRMKRIKNIEYFYDALLVFLLIYEFSLTSFDIFKNIPSYGNDSKDTYFFEFINVIYVLYIYNLKNRINIKITTFMVLHIILAISDGHRLMGITTTLLLFIIIIIPRVSKKIIPLFLFGGVFMLEAISMMRSGLGIDYITSAAMREESFSTHQGSVIYSSLSIIDFSSQYSLLEKMILSSQYTLSLFFSASWLPKDMLFTEAFRNYSYRPGGGLIFSFFYAFFGWFGALLSGYFISYALSWGRYFDRSMPVPPYAYLLVILMPRFFSYTPIHIFKTILFTVLVYFFIEHFLAHNRR